jgi:transcriptional regulator with XRE-family HTH domain
METKKSIDELLGRIKSATGLNQTEIAKRINYSREYLSQAKKGNAEHLYNLLFLEFKDELSGEGFNKPGTPGDPLNEARAIIKMLYQRVAKLESERLHQPLEDVMNEMDRDTTLARIDLEGQRKG